MNKKQIIVVILGLFLLILEVLSSSAQVKEKEPATKLEAFIAERGESIIPLVLSRRVHLEDYELGEVPGKYGGKIKLYSLVFYDPGEESKGVRGIKIRLTYPKIDAVVSEGGASYASSTGYSTMEGEVYVDCYSR